MSKRKQTRRRSLDSLVAVIETFRKPSTLWQTPTVTCTTLVLAPGQIEISLFKGGVLAHRQVFSKIDDAARHSVMLRDLHG